MVLDIGTTFVKNLLQLYLVCTMRRHGSKDSPSSREEDIEARTICAEDSALLFICFFRQMPLILVSALATAIYYFSFTSSGFRRREFRYVPHRYNCGEKISLRISCHRPPPLHLKIAQDINRTTRSNTWNQERLLRKDQEP